MLRIKPKQETFSGDYITDAVDIGGGEVDVELSMNAQVVRLSGVVFADVNIGDTAMCRTGVMPSVWQHVPAAEATKWLSVYTG